jgi:predicted metal-dependent hydrolase
MQPALPFDTAHDSGAEAPPGRDPGSAIPEPRSLILVRHPRARRYLIRVRDDGTIRVTVPRWGTKREAQAFAQRERAWIEKQLRRVEQDRLRYAGPQLVDGRPLTPDFERELRARAKLELPVRLLDLATQHRLSVTDVSVRNQRSRWGSCARGGRICLHWRLVTMPAWVCDYVMLHELMHLKQMNHSPKFWKLVAGVCPAYKEARAWLRDHARVTRR